MATPTNGGFAAQRAASPMPAQGASQPKAAPGVGGGGAPGGQFAAQAHQNFIENIKLLTEHEQEVKPEFIAFLQLIGGGSSPQGQQPTPPTRAPSAPAPTGGPAMAAPAPMSAAR